MLTKKKDGLLNIKWYEITDKDLYINRRRFINTTGKAALAGTVSLMAFPFVNRISADDGEVK
jgi:hypothetical protein